MLIQSRRSENKNESHIGNNMRGYVRGGKGDVTKSEKEVRTGAINYVHSTGLNA